MAMHPHHAEFLGEIERSEAALLSWGLVDGWLSEDELAGRAERFLDSHEAWGEHDDALAFIDAMTEQGLFFKWLEGGDYRYRTRMAEAVRLMARLRQLFPQHLRKAGVWATAPTLVSDYRFVLRARQYPRRDQDAAQCCEHWTAHVGAGRLTPLQGSVLRALLGVAAGGGGFALAGFQVRATSRILAMASGSSAAGTMICAGTGSGKTLAFYLPALVHLAGMIERDPSHWTRALAIYPRNELLKDQLTETCRQARRIRALLLASGRRPLLVGAYFGQTPHNAAAVTETGRGKPWDRLGSGRVCPFLTCPDASCSGAMIWPDADRERQVERLVCHRCAITLESDEIIFTRQRLALSPPDVLFTSTEMMNRHLTDSRNWHLFGVNVPPGKKPALVLLDEAHTYSGTHGAQVAHLLRRWRHRTQAKPHFVGLSATLMEAAAFFSQFTGLAASSVQEIAPESSEMIHEGMEYMLALRGDPVSGASLLSTTIQAAMLLRRVLDPLNGARSQGAYGRKVFLFTDDLDVTNRMYFNLLDAEGLDSRGRPDPRRHPEGSLAALRSSAQEDDNRRFGQGQSWRLCEALGHELSAQASLRLGRVSSQDSGVDVAAEVIVATASLEVGFNDPDVGAVLQHKAPREASAFLQRKGRAGRSREMRPWTVVVLSDFGRDRLAYQGYDQLFDPELRPRDLPLANRHVLKMQAAYACMDWIVTRLPPGGSGWFWDEASCPSDIQRVRERQQAAARVVEGVLAGGDDLAMLSEWLRGALGLSREDVQAVLWEPPRALMTAVLPTLHRRLSTEWQSGSRAGAEWHVRYHPLPEFVPAALFSDLQLPEVQVRAALGQVDGPDVFPMPVASALREFAPGRISRRFGIRHGLSRHWLPLEPNGPAEQEVDVSTFCRPDEREELGVFHYREDQEIRAVRVLRPFVLQVSRDAPREVKDSSNAFLDWHSQILAPIGALAGLAIDLPSSSTWSPLIEEIRFFTHFLHQPARVRRFSVGSRAQINLGQGVTNEITARFVANDEGADGQPVALGFAFEADAVRVRVRVPSDWRLTGGNVSPGKLPSLRAARFRWLVIQAPGLDGIANVFERGWLAEIVFAAVTANAVQGANTLQDAWTQLRTGHAELPLAAVLDVVFQTLPTEDEDDAARVEQKRISDLRALLGDPGTLSIMDACVQVLWEAPGEDWNPWLREKYLATIAAAFREAAQQTCPDIDAESLRLDLIPGPDENGILPDVSETTDLWITEDTPGGGGIVERLLPRLAEAPRRFLDLMRSAISESDSECSDRELCRFTQWAVNEQDQGLGEHLRRFRQASTLDELTASFRSLHAYLRQRGLQTSHPVMAALSSRLLRAGSTGGTGGTDSLVYETMARWRGEEERLGVELEARALAYALSGGEELDQALGDDVLPIGAGQDRRTWRFNALSSLLWPRGSLARNHALAVRQPFFQMPDPERLLVADLLEASEVDVAFGAEGWRMDFERSLVEHQRVALVTPADDLGLFKNALHSLLVHAVDAGSLLVYPRLRGIEHRGANIAAIFELVTVGHIIPPSDEELDPDTSRLIVKSARSNRDEIRELLESLFAIELLQPGEELWLVSPWISDIPVLDNRAGSYAGLEPSWPKRHLTLAELLAFALRTQPNCRLHVVTRPGEHTARFCDRLRMLTGLDGNADRLSLDDDRPELHTKGLVATGFALNGSMNFTYNGVEVLDETVQLEINPARVAQFRHNLHGHYA